MTDFAFVRHLVEAKRIPDDVTIQVLTQSREELIRRGLERVTRFTWRRTALATLDVYEQARRNGR